MVTVTTYTRSGSVVSSDTARGIDSDTSARRIYGALALALAFALLGAAIHELYQYLGVREEHPATVAVVVAALFPLYTILVSWISVGWFQPHSFLN
jgi:FtsH-binding integral membrane protein